MSPAAPRIVVSELAAGTGAAAGRVVVVGPSLGTRVDRLWGTVAGDLDGARVLGWDLPGHGLSPVASEGFSLADIAESVLAAVDEVVGGPAAPYAYAGDSVGGAIGLQLALDHPDRVSALAMLCSAARFGSAEAWAERSALVRDQGMEPIVGTTPGRWFGSRLRDSPSEAAQEALRDLAAVHPESYALVCDALGRFDLTDRLGELTVPLVAVAGADDPVTPPALLRDLAAQVPQGRLAVLPGVGHLAPLDDPDRTAALLRGHFAAVSASAG